MIKALQSLWRQITRDSDRALLPADSRQVRPLTIVVSIMCALGCLAGLGASAGLRVANTWTSDLKSALSVVVQSPRTDEDLIRAAQIVRRVEGVTRSEAMSRDRAKDLLRNYGTDMGATLDALPVPRLIEVGVAAGQTNVKTDIEKALKASGYNVVVDDHSRFTGEVLRTSTVVRIVAILVGRSSDHDDWVCCARCTRDAAGSCQHPPSGGSKGFLCSSRGSDPLFKVRFCGRPIGCQCGRCDRFDRFDRICFWGVRLYERRALVELD